MGIEHLSPITLSHIEASSETLEDMRANFAEFEAAELEEMLARFQEEPRE